VDPVEDELTDDAITRDFRVWQRRRGHRYSLDDVATAWTAAQARPRARRALDLGCGIGSVLLMVAWKLPDAVVHGVEAQPGSFALAVRNVERNALERRVALFEGDLRHFDVPHPRGYDLVTGTPPYLPPGSALPSPDPQRTAARIELRGGVEEYLAAASRALAPGGRVVVCADARRPDRVVEGARAASLVPLARLAVVPRAGHPGLFTVWTLAHVDEPHEALAEHALVVRDEAGRVTEHARGVRAAFGLG
jgi:tRNA1(Val) A37 N6-methylase TrmN6